MSMDLYSSDHDQMAELYHYGVKGMKWGVRRARRGVVEKAYGKNSEVRKAADKSASSEEAANKAWGQQRSANRAAGMNPIKAGKAAAKDPKVAKLESKFVKDDAALGSAHDRASAMVKSENKRISELAKQVKKDNPQLSTALKQVNALSRGQKAAGLLLTGPAGLAAYGIYKSDQQRRRDFEKRYNG